MTKLEDQLEVLRGTRRLLASRKSWCKKHSAVNQHGLGVSAYSPNAVSWCLAGAIGHENRRVVGDSLTYPVSIGVTNRLLRKVLFATTGEDELTKFNDKEGTLHGDILRLLDNTISLVEALDGVQPE